MVRRSFRSITTRSCPSPTCSSERKMALITPDVLPAVAEGIHRQILAAPAQRVREETLLRRVSPPGLKSAGGQKMVSDTVRELRSIGAIVATEDDQLTLPDDVARGQDQGGMARI